MSPPESAASLRYTDRMQSDIDQVLIPREEIAQRVKALAESITRDVTEAAAESADDPAQRGEITFVPILTGSFIFVADLIRHLPLYMQIRLISVSSYPGPSTTSRGARLRAELSDLPESLAGQHALVVDDILDSGSTLRLVTDLLRKKRPASLRTCVLLRKNRPEAMSLPVDYVCFDIPDRFVVGYGLDYNDYYRNLPDIVTLRPEVLAGGSASKSMATRP